MKNLWKEKDLFVYRHTKPNYNINLKADEKWEITDK